MELEKNKDTKTTGSKTVQGQGGESEIKQLVESMKTAILKGDIEKIMSFYDENVIAFDMVPPAQYMGKSAYRKSWEKALADMGPSSDSHFDIVQLQVKVDQNLAVSHSLNHCFGKDKEGKEMVMWMRISDVYKKTPSGWKIIHEHVSVPVDFASGKALMNEAPTNEMH